jgi:hypothetical protein
MHSHNRQITNEIPFIRLYVVNYKATKKPSFEMLVYLYDLNVLIKAGKDA